VFKVRFSSVFIKKSNQTEFFKKKKKPKPNRNQFKPTGFGSVQFFRAKTGLARFFRFWLGFLSGFFRFGSVFPVPGLKNRTEPVGFFKILIGLIWFFERFGFFGYFFSGFLGLIGFSVFLNTPTHEYNLPTLFFS
jgi:hypothetical protein